MNILAIHHEAKSKYAYAYDEKSLHIRLRTAKSDVKHVSLLWGDPFNWKREKGEVTWAYAKDAPMAMVNDYSDSLYDYWFIEVVPDYKRTKYAFILNGDDVAPVFFGSHGATDMTRHPEIVKSLNEYFNFPYINAEDVFKAPKWVEDTVWYQIFPERFANGDASLDKPEVLPWGSEKEVTNEMHFGGDLKGVIDRLDYIADLGATGIYFTPIFEAPTTHKYDTIDYHRIDPEFGDNETFKILVEEAHKRGIRVMLDAVFNHCGFKHPYFQDVVKMGMASEYAQCFHLLSEPVVNFELNTKGFPAPKKPLKAGDLNYETFAFTPNMPKWRTSNPVAEKYLLDVATYWIENYDIDGWRLDVSNEVSHTFWRKFKETVRAVKPDLFILGENWDDSNPWLGGDQFDSVMNYEFTYPVWHLLSRESNYSDFGVEAFKDSISRLLVSYPKHVARSMFNLLDSHDTSRLHTMLNDDVRLVKLAFVIQMTFGGSPSVYYGSEIGLYGVHDGNRQCMVWDEAEQNLDLLAHVKQLIALRKAHYAMKTVDLSWIELDGSDEVLGYRKGDAKEGIVVLINMKETSQIIDLKALGLSLTHDLYAEAELTLSERDRLSLDGFDFRILSYTSPQ